MLVVSTRPGSWHGPKRVRMLVASTRQRSWPSRAEPKNKNATRDFEDRTFPCHSDMGRQTCLRVSGTTSRHSRHGNRSNTAQRGSMNLLLSEFEYRSNSEFEALVGPGMEHSQVFLIFHLLIIKIIRRQLADSNVMSNIFTPQHSLVL